MKAGEQTATSKQIDLEFLAGQVCRRGLAVPAIFMLELHKPLTTLAHGALTVSSPLIASLFGTKRLDVVLDLLSDRNNVEQLIRLIETQQSKGKASA